MKIFDAVFIQPTYGCALNCPGCYVKESVKHKQVQANTICDFLEWLWDGSRVYTRQITLAVDNLPPTHNYNWHTMVKTMDKCLELRQKYGNRTEFHMTVHSVKALIEYLGAAKKLCGYPLVDLLSISDITGTHDEWCWLSVARDSGQKINWNYTVPTSIDGLDGGYTELNRFYMAINCVDTVHLVLHKPGLGESYTSEVIEAYKKFLRVLNNNLNPEQKTKIIVDGCVRDSYNFVTKGYGCGANTRKIHLWPDGHVSGCPYNTRGGSPAYTLKEIIENVYDATTAYEFTDCQIPVDYYHKSPRGEDHTTQPDRSRLRIIGYNE